MDVAPKKRPDRGCGRVRKRAELSCDGIQAESPPNYHAGSANFLQNYCFSFGSLDFWLSASGLVVFSIRPANVPP